ncbi:retrovirus-related pol polyprotein from transposon TNT 1-94 [Tanacetum coccineum]
MEDIIREKNAQFTDFEKEINYLKQTLSEQSKENELLTKTFNVLKNESKEKEAKNIDKEIALENKVKELDNIVCKIGQSAQTMHMLTKPQVFYDNNLKQALSFQNPFYLKKAQQIRPMLYDGSVIAKETNVISIVDSEEILMLEEESRSKMLLKQSDPKVLQKKVNIKPINYVELNRDNKNCLMNKLSGYKLHTLIQTNLLLRLSKLRLLGNYLRITSDALTEGEWGFEHTKAVFLKEIIPFVKTLKDIFNVFDKDLLNDVTKVQTVFNQMEAAVQQYHVDKQCFEIQKKRFLIENDRLLDQIISQDIVNIVVNSSMDINTSVNVNSSVAMNDSVNYVEMCNKYLELEAELIKQYNMVEKYKYNKISKRFFELEQHCISLEIAMQLNKENFQKNNTFVNQTEPSFNQLFELNNLKAELQAKDTTIKKLKENLNHTMEQAAILREIVEQAKLLNPLDSASHSACKYVKLIQELLGYVRDTCPDIHKPRVSRSTKFSRSKSTDNTKNDMILSMFEARHELCFLEFVTDMNANSKSKSVKKAKKKEEWKPTRKVITATNKVPLMEPIPLEVIAQEYVVTNVYTRRPKLPKTNGSNSKPKIAKSVISNKTEPGTSQGSNTSVAPSSSSVDLRKPDLSYLHVFGALFYPNNDSEDLGKLQAKADIGIFIGYAPKKKAYRIYNRHTRKIIETIHVDFDELTVMASEQIGLGPGLQSMTPTTSSSGLIPNHIPQQPCIPPPRDDWDRLFQPMFDEYFNPLTIVVSLVLVAAAPRAVDLADSPVSTLIDQDAPSTSIPSTQDQEHSLIIFQGSSSNVRPIYTPVESLGRWTKDHPIANVIGDPSRSVSTRKQLQTDVMWCYFDAFLTSVEPKNFKQAMTEPSWIDAMQEEIHEFVKTNEFGKVLKNMARLVAQGFSLLTSDFIDTTMVEKRKVDEDLQGKPVDATLYRVMIGSLMYLTSSRPDLIYAVCLCARYQAKPTEKHLNAITQGVRTLDAVHQEMRSQLTDYGFQFNKIPLYCDNKSGIALCCNNVQHSRAKHIDVRYHFIKEKVKNGIVELYFVRTEYQLADIFTKPLPRERFNFLIEKLDNALVAPENRHVIGKCNMRINPRMKPKEPTYQVVLDVLALTTCYPAFLVTTEVPVIYMHQDILNICPRIQGQDFDELPTEEEAISFIRELGHSKEIKYIIDVIVSGLDKIRLSRVQILYGMYYKKNLDFVALIWEDLAYQIDNIDSKKQDKMFYPRFTMIIIHHFLDKDKSISMKNRTFMHTARDDSLLGTGTDDPKRKPKSNKSKHGMEKTKKRTKS